MSHSTRLTIGGGGGGTLDKLTANIGLPAVPDGANNINIVGVGIIQTEVDALAPNTVRITAGAIAASFEGNAGIAVPAAGVLNIVGLPNTVTTTAAGNTISIGFDDDVKISFLEVENNLTVDANTYLHGQLSVDGLLTAYNDMQCAGTTTLQTLRVESDAFFDYLVHFNDLPGVLMVEVGHLVRSTQGLDGQLLIGATGQTPVWHSLTAGYGIQILEDPWSITIATSDVIARSYNADVGIAIPAAHIVSILGGTNIETSAVGSVVTILTKADVIFDTVGATTVTVTDLVQAARATIIGVVNAGTVVTTSVNASDFVICDHINTAADATIGQDISVGRFLNVASDATIGGDLLVQEDAAIAGDLRLASHTNGVLITDATGFIDASNGSPAGTNGQVLISGGVRPVWNTLESADGSVAITYPTANRIDLKVTTVATDTVAFIMSMNNEVPWAANNVETNYFMGQKLAMNIALDTHGGCYAGDGAAAAAYFQCPYNGYMQFNAVMTVKKSSYWEVKNASIYLHNLTDGKDYQMQQNYLASPFNGASMMVAPYMATLNLSCFQRVTPASRWAIKIYLHARSDAISQNFMLGRRPIAGGYDAVAEFSGFLAYKL
jgi:hypothetical protein